MVSPNPTLTDRRPRHIACAGRRAALGREASPDEVLHVRDDLLELREIGKLRRRVRAMSRRGAATLTLDLTNVRHADTTVVACIVLAHRIARRSGMILDVRCSDEVRRWVDLCRLSQLIERPANT